MRPTVVLLETGTANIASMRAGLVRAGADVRPATGPEDVRDAERVLLPGVGAFGAARAALAVDGCDEALRDRIRHDRPTLCVCVGLQLLAEASEESPGIAGLGVVPGTVRRFDAGPRTPAGGAAMAEVAGAAAAGPASGVTTAVAPHPCRVPQMGWNHVTADPGCRRLADGHLYFANSYALDEVPDGWAGAVGVHGRPFVAGFERGAVVACQFHPELSGRAGAAILARWLEGA